MFLLNTLYISIFKSGIFGSIFLLVQLSEIKNLFIFLGYFLEYQIFGFYFKKIKK